MNLSVKYDFKTIVGTIVPQTPSPSEDEDDEDQPSSATTGSQASSAVVRMPQARETLQMDQSEDEDEEAEVTLVVGASRNSACEGLSTSTSTNTTEPVHNKPQKPKVQPAPGFAVASTSTVSIQTPRRRYVRNNIPYINIRRPLSPQWIISKSIRGPIPAQGNK
jgi:hypothetical protein